LRQHGVIMRPPCCLEVRNLWPTDNIMSWKKWDFKVWVKYWWYCLVWIVGNLVTVSILQNGSIWDGLEHWKSNLDKRFEGVEECNICFSVVQSSNLEIPRQSCSKCKKKFHSACLVSKENIPIPNWCHPFFQQTSLFTNTFYLHPITSCSPAADRGNRGGGCR